MDYRTIITAVDSIIEVQGVLHFIDSTSPVELDEKARAGKGTVMRMVCRQLGHDARQLAGMVTQPGNMPN